MFFDRQSAGTELATLLSHHKDTDAVVCALPRGGVVTGCEVAKTLGVPLNIVVTRKIGHPLNRAVPICATTEHGGLVCSDHGLCGVDKEWIEREATLQQEEARRDRTHFSAHHHDTPLKGRTAIVIDDGIATGLSAQAAIISIRNAHPSKLVLAAPVAPHQALRELSSLVDEVVVVRDAHRFRGSVARYYVHFPEVSDSEVRRCLQAASHQIAVAHLA